MRPVLIPFLAVSLLLVSVSSAKSQGYIRDLAKRPVPEGITVTLETARPTFFLGESIPASFEILNGGQAPVDIELVGDNRGALRLTRYHMTATDGNGVAVSDLEPLFNDFNGLSSGYTRQPGAAWYDTISLSRYLDFKVAGTYTVTAQHDGDWTASPEHPMPTATTKVEMVMPTFGQAREVINRVEAVRDAPYNGHVYKQFLLPADYSTFHYPVYLPLLLQRVDAGNLKFLQSLSALRTPAASRALVERLGGEEIVAQQIAAVILRRLPPIYYGAELMKTEGAATGFKIRQQIAEAAWLPEFDLPTRNYARHALLSDDRQTLRTGAAILGHIGTAEDFPAIVAALDKRIADITKAPRWQSVGASSPDEAEYLQADAMSLMRAGSAIMGRGAMLNAPDSPGAIAIRLNHRRDSLQYDWMPEYAKWLRDPLPFIRQTALESLRPLSLKLPMPPAVLVPEERVLLPVSLADPDTSVRVAACDLAADSGDKTLLPDVLKVLASAQNQWLIDRANGTAGALGGQFQVWTTWADRIDQPQMMRTAIVELSGIIGIRHASRWTGTIEPGEGAQIKLRWQKFLADNKERLQNGRLFSQTNADWPKDLLPKTFEISP